MDPSTLGRKLVAGPDDPTRISKDPDPTPPTGTPVVTRNGGNVGVPVRESPSLMLALGALLVFVAVMLTVWVLQQRSSSDEAERSDPLADLNRALDLNETPAPGSSSGQLGFGDSVGGREPLSYEAGNSDRSARTFNAYVDVPGGVEDERMFMRVTAAPSRSSHPPPARSFSSDDRSTEVSDDEVAWVRVYAHNSGPVSSDGHNCAVLDPELSLAGSTLRIAIWQSEQLGHTVVRGWLASPDANPRWVTDAIVVSSDRALELLPERSMQYQQRLLPNGEADPDQPSYPSSLVPLTEDPSEDGITIADEGQIGPCWQNRWLGFFALG